MAAEARTKPNGPGTPLAYVNKGNWERADFSQDQPWSGCPKDQI